VAQSRADDSQVTGGLVWFIAQPLTQRIFSGFWKRYNVEV